MIDWSRISPKWKLYYMRHKRALRKGYKPTRQDAKKSHA